MHAQHPVTDQRLDLAMQPEPRPPRSFAGPYLAAWAVLAALALGYMAVLLLQPEWTGTMTTQSLRSEPAPPPAPPPLVQQLTREVDGLRRTVADLQRELSYIKTSTTLLQEANAARQAADQETSLQDRAAALEAEPAAAQAGTIQPKALAAAAEPARREAPKPAAAAPPEPAKAKKKVVVLNAKPAEKPKLPEALETGSLQPVEQPRITFGPPTVTPAAEEAVAIHLDAGPSLDALRLRWGVLHDRHQSALSRLEPRYLTGGTMESPSYQLLAGPVASREEAARICALLRARRVPCSVGGPFVGEAL